jgi:hypothetical protein
VAKLQASIAKDRALDNFMTMSSLGDAVFQRLTLTAAFLNHQS